MITKKYLYYNTNTYLINMKYKVTLFSVATISATVFVDAVSEDDAAEIATTSCCIDDFEIDELDPESIETIDIEGIPNE